MISLIFDTETTGVADQKLSIKDPNQPYLVELAFELFDSEQGVMAAYSTLIIPDIPIPESATKVHGITDEMVQKFGVSPRVALSVFYHHMKQADRIVAHNIAFDYFVIQVNFDRVDISGDMILQMPTLCTMKKSIDIVAIEKPEWQQKKYGGKYKWPNLDETFRCLVDPEGFSDAHRASHDVTATREILRALEELNAD